MSESTKDHNQKVHLHQHQHYMMVLVDISIRYIRNIQKYLQLTYQQYLFLN
jgi:hypothetical protein